MVLVLIRLATDSYVKGLSGCHGSLYTIDGSLLLPMLQRQDARAESLICTLQISALTCCKSSANITKMPIYPSRA